MRKRLIIINLILIFLIWKIPIYSNEDMEVIDNTITEIEITSRSLDVSRETIEDETEEIIELTTVSENCINIIKEYEGLRLTAYLNEGEEYYTIGYGHHDKDVYEGQTITEEQAENLLYADIQGYCEYIINYCSYLDLNQNELDALVSFSYNLGIGNLHKLTANKTRTKTEIADCMLNYVNRGSIYESGLTKRRIAERNLFLGEV